MYFVRTFVAVAAAVCLFDASTVCDIIHSETTNVQEICSLLAPGSSILRPNSCTNWFRCPSTADGNDFEEGSCVIGLYYDKNSQQCLFKDRVECPYANNMDDTNADICSTAIEGSYLADTESDNCSGYIYCQNRQALHANCPRNLVFNPEEQSCVYTAQYTCPAKTARTKKSPICRSIPNDKMFADDQWCHKYHKCVDDVLESFECDDSMSFDTVTGTCVTRDDAVCMATAKQPEPEITVCHNKDAIQSGGYFTDSISCSGYYICEKQADGTPDRHPKHVHCENGYFFDSEKWSCRDRLNVKCTFDRCEGMGNKYVNVAGDCSAYVRCSNGTALNAGKCPDNYFFDERTQGCTVHNISYAACSA